MSHLRKITPDLKRETKNKKKIFTRRTVIDERPQVIWTCNQISETTENSVTVILQAVEEPQ